ncbi:aminoglycoside 3-N-acetyltransferase [Sanguibacter gelidistatuariae]|uniref:Aminoglycoside N(3)-acetyltransferase n=1 Tax=Sanguibacter gelidistatuariae TaxID=1814289 RepID=A0A1G6VNT0_9MICO|nr:aminoglycoside 3-N-acetyltransferase [Sanguibacter gelidistatuariae]
MNRSTVPISLDAIVSGLTGLGLRAGHHVLVHSSLSALGRVAGGAQTVVDALLQVVGPSGTVLVPTLTGTEADGEGVALDFDLAQTPCWTGAVAEAARRRPEAIRSAHPTHSVAAIGAAAARLTSDHEQCITPCGTGSPYAKLAADPDGVVLLLGCDHESNTTLHHVEELAGVSYHLHPEPVPGVVRFFDRTETRDYWVHSWGTPRRFSAIEPLLDQRGLQTRRAVGAADARLMSAGLLVTLALDVLRADPRFFIAEQARMSGANRTGVGD